MAKSRGEMNRVRAHSWRPGGRVCLGGEAIKGGESGEEFLMGGDYSNS